MADEKKLTKANTMPVGKSGTLVINGVIEDDYLQDLIGIEGQIIYEKMITSEPTIRKLYHAVTNPIKSALWAVESASDDQADIDKAALIDKILFQNLPDGFVSFLDEVLTFPWHGHAVFEPIHKNYIDKELGPYTGLLNIAFRDQRTLDKWNFDAAGILKSVHQKQSGDLEVDVDIPAENLLIFYNEKKGNNNGFAFCRMLYGNYKRKLLYKQLQAIGIERGAIGTPVLELADGVDFTSKAYEDAVRQLEAYVLAENAFMILPNGYKVDLKNQSTFDPAKIQSAIKAENEEISGSLVAMWLEMGIGGNSAVGSSTTNSAEFFRKGIEYIADKIVQVINKKIIPNLIELNYPDSTTKYPELTYSGISDADGEVLMRIVTGYVDKKVINPDPLLEDHVRSINNLPKRPEGEAIDNPDDPINPENENEQEEKTDEVEETEANLNDKVKQEPVPKIINDNAEKVSQSIRDQLNFSSQKYINDVMKKYKTLPESKKLKAIDDITMAGEKNLTKSIKSNLIQAWNDSLNQVKKEIPGFNDISLSTKDFQEKYWRNELGDKYDQVKLNEISKLPTHIQILLQTQAALIAQDSINELKKRINFTFVSNQTKTDSESLLNQYMTESANEFSESNTVTIKGDNVAALIVNEARNTFFLDDDVKNEIHSFTYSNRDPKSPICKELTGKSISPDDAESMLYAPPNHHGCKSYLRANLKSSRGVDQIQITTWSPSETAKRSVTI